MLRLRHPVRFSSWALPLVIGLLVSLGACKESTSSSCQPGDSSYPECLEE